MSAPNSDTRGPLLALAAMGSLTLALGVVWLAVDVGAPDVGQSRPGNPFALAVELVSGKRAWPDGKSTLVVAGGLTVLVVLAVLGVVWKLRHPRGRVDHAARTMAGSRQLRGITGRDVKATARRLRPGVQMASADEHGVLLGRTVVEQHPVRMDWEGVGVAIAGPRTGKSTSLAIPAILAAPGPVVVTSNKADVHDATRTPREDRGTVWVFDPQHIASPGGPCPWWVNLLAPVHSPATAERLAGHLADGNTDPNARTDAYFDTEGRSLLATYILAAALGGGDLMHVREWITSADSDIPHQLLSQHGHPEAAESARRFLQLNVRQKDGLYGTAAKLIRVLDEPSYAQWVTPPQRWKFVVTAAGPVEAHLAPGPHRDPIPEFDSLAFVAGGTQASDELRTAAPGGRPPADTLFLLSMEGPAAATSLTTAFAAQLFGAGQLVATASPGRRLATPLLFILDEAANVCRIRQLPDLYSHFGSRGMPVLTILQGWSQGVECWTEAGMQKLWSAANIKFYGGGVSEANFLRDLSTMIGDHDVEKWSRSTGRGGSSRSQSFSREAILSSAALQALPRGRAVLLSSGNPAALLETVPWMAGPHAATITESLAKWGSASATAEQITWALA
jgi:type IV secretory pathway TraG/TraD family ATPase VirD4